MIQLFSPVEKKHKFAKMGATCRYMKWCPAVPCRMTSYVNHYFPLPRSVFHKTWMCHLSNRNKSKDSQRSTDCKAKIDIKVKKLNRNTKRKDKYLRRDPPLSAIIHLELKHNHHVQCNSVLKYLRISQEVTEEFECYFRDGLTPIEACEVHEMKIKLHKNADINLADGCINPSLRKVYHLYHKWRRVTAAGAQPIITNSSEVSISGQPLTEVVHCTNSNSSDVC